MLRRFITVCVAYSYPNTTTPVMMMVIMVLWFLRATFIFSHVFSLELFIFILFIDPTTTWAFPVL